MPQLRSERKLDAHLALIEAGRNVCFISIKSSAPPPPDPAIGQASQAMADVAREQLAFSKEQYAESLPRIKQFEELVNQVVQGQIKSSEEQSALAKDYESYMKETFRPVEKSLVEDAMTYDTPARQDREAQKAAADVSRAFGLQREMQAREMQRAGINPAAPKYRSQELLAGLGEAATKAGAMTGARENVENIGWAKRMDAAGLGRGLPGNQATSASLALNAGNSAVGNAGQPINAYNQAGSQYMGGLSAAGGMYGGSGSLASNAYSQQLNAWNAKQQSNAGMWGGVGSLVGLGISAGLPGGGTVFSKMLGYKRGGIVRAGVRSYKCGGLVKKGRRHYEEGGMVEGPGGPMDDEVPAQLSDGEGVLNAGAVKIVGEDFVNRVNQYGLDLMAKAGYTDARDAMGAGAGLGV